MVSNHKAQNTKLVNIRFKKLIIHSLLIPILVMFFCTQYQGIDFGAHWDEGKIIRSITRSLQTGFLLPRQYYYPSMSYNIALLNIAPYMLKIGKQVLTEGENVKGIIKTSSKKIVSKGFKLQIRAMFLISVLLTLIWTYILIFVWKNRWTEALLGASLLGFSWEVAYHARWIAPDGILMQFTILTMLLLFLSIKSVNHKICWLRLSALTAGLACGSKYPGGILFLPVLITYFYLQKISKQKYSVSFECIILTVIFCATFVVTTPGAVIEPTRFARDVQYEINHYQKGHGGYTVKPGIEHALLLGTYLSCVVFSKYLIISLFFFVIMFIGVYSILKDSRGTAIIFLSIPVPYILYMCTQRVMFVRNYLILIPFMAILTARGLIYCLESFPSRPYRIIMTGVILVFFGFNLVWLIEASNSILGRKTINHGDNIAEYIYMNKDTQFYLSKPVYELIPASKRNKLLNITSNYQDAEQYVFSSSEFKDKKRWLANRYSLYTVISGSYEVNFNYYPTWCGDSKIVSMHIIKAKRMGIFKENS